MMPTYDASNNPAGPVVAPPLAQITPLATQAAMAQPVIQDAGTIVPTPTPDRPKALPTVRTLDETYTVKSRDTLSSIALKFNIDVAALMQANEIQNANLLYVGQVLKVPAPILNPTGSSFKIIPDSELVLSPRTANFSVSAFVTGQKGYLASYREVVDEIDYSGAAIIERIAREYSVNPRLLLAALEFQSHWVTQPTPPEQSLTYPMGRMETYRKGLYRQLAWAANTLNRGYYLWRVNGAGSWLLTDGSLTPVSPHINAGTAGVQQFFAQLYGRTDWNAAVGEQGLYRTYAQFFGNPFSDALEPLVPSNLKQPPMQLPFESGKVWSFTGGPHGGWGEGSAWAAIDFAPPGEGGGCRASSEWVVAVANGVIVRSELGEVVQDLDGDGDERTGWSILYMHIGSNDRVRIGAQLKAGDRIGHPSCEGGVSNGTHTHLARRYNGEWIPADGPIPFNLDGWISAGDGIEYYGSLTRNGEILEPWDAKTNTNQIWR